MKCSKVFLGTLCALLSAASQKAEPILPEESDAFVSVADVAELLSNLPIGVDQVKEVFDAASASASNGYDEEYRMQDLFQRDRKSVV